MTLISGIATNETDMANVAFLEGERGDGTPVKIDPDLMGYLGAQIITATGAGVFAPSAGANRWIVEVQGAGGGGGGTAATAAGQVAIARPGAGGGYARKTYTNRAAITGAAYNVGAKGPGGVGNATGTVGGNTTFTVSGVALTGNGGSGGTAGAATGTVPTLAGAGSGGTGLNGDINIRGGHASGPIALAASNAAIRSGTGGTSQFSSGAASSIGTSNQIHADGYGGGGGGACAAPSTAAQTGGNGSDGIIIVHEFSH